MGAGAWVGPARSKGVTSMQPTRASAKEEVDYGTRSRQTATSVNAAGVRSSAGGSTANNGSAAPTSPLLPLASK